MAPLDMAVTAFFMGAMAGIGCKVVGCHGARRLAFRAATAKALTTVFAGLALTMTVLPNISLLPALVAGFFLVLMRHRPGIVKMPVFFTSPVPISARLAMNLLATVFFSSSFVARASAMAPLDMAVPM